MKYYLGIDQGGTKTAAVVCDENGVIKGKAIHDGLVTGYFNDTDEIYIKNIRSAAIEALEQADLTLEYITAVNGCLNGADWDFEYPVLQQSLSRAVSCNRTIVMNDCIGGMRGGSAAKACAVVSAGSGLNIAIRTNDGREIIYGYFIHEVDQGGSALGRAALNKVLDAYMGICPETLLAMNVLTFTGYNNAQDLLIDMTMGRYELKTKELVGCLLNAYRREDEQANQIVQSFAQRIAKYITTAMIKFDILHSDLPLVFSGSVFKDDGTLIANQIAKYVKKFAPNIQPIHAKYEPVCGAVLILLDEHYGGTLPKQVTEAFDQSATRMDLVRKIKLNEM